MQEHAVLIGFRDSAAELGTVLNVQALIMRVIVCPSALVRWRFYVKNPEGEGTPLTNMYPSWLIK